MMSENKTKRQSCREDTTVVARGAPRDFVANSRETCISASATQERALAIAHVRFDGDNERKRSRILTALEALASRS